MTDTIQNHVAPTENVQNEHTQALADKAAIDASANYHLKHIHETIGGGTTAAVAQILGAAERNTNWTLDEVLQVWDRVYNESRPNLSAPVA